MMSGYHEGVRLSTNWNYMQSFPNISELQVERLDILETIYDVYDSENNVVFLEGESGIGATTVMAQFVAKNLEHTFSLFLSPASRYSYSIDYVKLQIAEQLTIFLEDGPFEKAAIDEAEFSALLFRTKAKFKGKNAYFVVDGLAHIPLEDDSCIAMILNSALPIGLPGFRFLISGPQSRLAKSLNKSTSKTCQLRRFTDLEMDTLFEEFSISQKELNDLKQLCRGNPGRLCAVRRQLKVGTALSEVLEGGPDKYLDFIALDFKNFDDLNVDQKKAIALLAFSKQLVSRLDFKAIIKFSIEDVGCILEKCTFLEVVGKDLVRFVSSSHRKYAENKLKLYQSEVLDLQIEYLTQDPESNESLLFLPSYLLQRNSNVELINLISNEHYYSLLSSTQSLTQLRNRAELGIQSAQAESDWLSIFKFSLQKGLFVDLLEASASKSEVNALVAIGKTQHAMRLVERALTKISKLSLLTAYANGLKRRSKNVDSFLLGQIVQLIRTVEFSDGGDTALQIAEDLVSVDVNLASEVLEKCLCNINDPKHKDLAFSRFSIAASMDQKDYSESSFEGQIKSKAVKKFTAAMTQFHKNESSSEIISFFESSKIKNKTAMLIHFVSTQDQREGLLDLVSYVLGVIQADVEFVVTLKDLADLAAPLRFHNADSELLTQIINVFDSQLELVKDKTEVRDLVTLSTYLSCVEAKKHCDRAYNRLLDAYYAVCDSTDYEIQSECYVRLFYALRLIDPDDKFEKDEGFKSIVDQGLKLAVSELLCNAASQYDCIESVLPAMIEHDISEAFNLASRLNTLQNRYSALQLIAEALVKKPSTTEALIVFQQVVSSIKYNYKQSELLLSCTLIVNRGLFDSGWAGKLRAAIDEVENPAIVASCKIKLFKYYVASDSPMSPSYLVDAIKTLISVMPQTATRNEICFNAVEALSEVSKDEAENIYRLATESRGTLEFENQDVQNNFVQCLTLTVRSFGVALRNNVLTPEMLGRLSDSIGKLSSPRQKIALYTDLACRAWIADNMLKTIVSEYCSPLLESTRRTNMYLYQGLLEIAFPALFVFHSESALKDIACLPEPNKNTALYNACGLIRRHQTATDPSASDSSEEFSLSYSQAADIITLMEHMTYDATIYQTLESLVRSVSSKRNKSNFSSAQRKDLGVRLIHLIDAKLPDGQNISHKGYFICSLAKAYMVSDATLPQWQRLIDDAGNIPNEADKAFVFIKIMDSMPTKMAAQKNDLLVKSEFSSNEIPWLVDKIGRLELCALTCKDSNVPAAKKILRESFLMSHHIDDMEVAADTQKSLIDAADQIDPKFAEELSRVLDENPARAGALAYAKHNLKVVKAKKVLADCNGTESERGISDEYLSEASWKNLSSLLSGRITAKNMSALTQYMHPNLGLGLGELYPLLCWYIENLGRKYISSEDVKRNVLPMCETLLKTSELAIEVVCNKVHSSHHTDEFDSSVKGIIIKPNTRASALEYIQNWLNQNCIEYVKFCDPYFSSDDIEVVQMIQAANSSCKIHILAVAGHLKAKNCASNDDFESAWNKISDQTAPETYIYGIGKLDGADLIHDRWIISKGVGLRLGTSFNSIGYKVSEISVMTPGELADCEAQLNVFLNDPVIINGARVKTTRYEL